MKKVSLLLPLLIGFFFYPAYGSEHQNDTCSGTMMRKIYDNSPYVVAVESERPSDPASSQEKRGPGSGSGLVIKEKGISYVLTNNHVIDFPLASSVWVSLPGRPFKYEVSIVGRDPAIDLAILAAPVLPSGIGEAVLGGPVSIGDVVYAFGYPYGVRSITCGYVNALQSTEFSFSWLHPRHQAPVNPGNSGGPIFNVRHEVVGINVAIVTGATIAFSIPAQYIKRVLPRLTREKLVQHGAAGFGFNDVSRLSPTFFRKKALPYPPTEENVIVYSVQPNSYAERAGLRAGDAILRLNGALVKNARELDMKIFFDHRPDEEVVLTTQRGSQVIERRVTLTEYVSPFQKQSPNDNN